MGLAAAAAVGLVLSAGCTPSPESALAAKAAPGEAGPQFLAPPSPTSARRLSTGEIELAGRAAPGSAVSLRNPDGQSIGATTDGAGGWTLRLPLAAVPRLYALSAVLGPRTLRGEGALLSAPAPGPPAMLLRAGAAAVALDEANGALRLEALDFDPGGVAAAGVGPPQTALRLSLDDRPASVGQTDAQGRFALMAVQGDLQPGAHALHLEGAGRTVEVHIDATPAALPPGQPYGVRKVEGGWRIDWATPGGGAQSAVVFVPGFWGSGG